MGTNTDTALPTAVTATLWSYDSAKLDPVKHRKLIINAVLNYGTKEATDWAFRYYGSAEVQRVAQTIPLGAWDTRSLALWSTVLSLKPIARAEHFA
jgi:hypothetical protein